ncbi:MAG: CotH kinase family protein [Deltaproteobacteria bacterium]|nr:CotH kinase family protein [Deltaproteobacteria bacterium]
MTQSLPTVGLLLALVSALGACGDDGGSGADPSEVLFDPGRIVEIDITLADSDWQALREQTRTIDALLGDDCQSEPFGSPFTYFEGDVTIDGELFAQVGVRKKGFFGSLSDIKPSLKIKLDEYVEGQELYGYERLTLNNNRQDPARIKQCLSYQLFAAAGVPAPRCNFARVTVNGEDLGLYANVETVKKRFLRRYYEDEDGMLFEGTLSDFREGWSGTLEPKTNELEPDFARPDELTAILASANDSELIEALEPVVDLDLFYSFWAMEAFVAHGDGYAGNTNNYFLYVDPDDQRIDFVPWGVDSTFNQFAVQGPGGAPAASVYVNGVLAKRLYQIPAGRARYFERLEELLEQVWDESALLAEIDRMESLIEAVAADDPLHAARILADDIDAVRDFVEERRDLFQAEIDVPPELDQPLRDQFCFRPLGTASGTFDTSYGSNADPNPFAAGSSTLAVTLDDEAQAIPGPFGSNAGENEDDASLATVTVIAQVDATLGAERYLVAAVSLSKTVFGPGTYDIEPLRGFLVDIVPNTGQFTVVGFLATGTITLTAAGLGDGDPVIGSFSAEVYASPF